MRQLSEELTNAEGWEKELLNKEKEVSTSIFRGVKIFIYIYFSVADPDNFGPEHEFQS